MSCELVTGTAGKPHITSKQIAAFNQGTTVRSVCALSTKHNLNATIDGQYVVIDTGDLVMQGRHVTCEEPTRLKISPCGFNKKRIDLIVVRYEKDEHTGVESASLAVVEGQETSGVPSAPVPVMGKIDDGALLSENKMYTVTSSGGEITSVKKDMYTLSSLARTVICKDGWEERKESDGCIECFGTFLTPAMTIDNAFGSLFNGDSFYAPNYPEAFRKPPTVTVTITASDDGAPGAGFTLSQGTTTKPPRVIPTYPKEVKEKKRYEVHITARGY